MNDLVFTVIGKAGVTRVLFGPGGALTTLEACSAGGTAVVDGAVGTTFEMSGIDSMSGVDASAVAVGWAAVDADDGTGVGLLLKAFGGAVSSTGSSEVSFGDCTGPGGRGPCGPSGPGGRCPGGPIGGGGKWLALPGKA